MNPKILEALAVTCAVTNTDLPEAAIRVMERDLAAYPERHVLDALVRCRREVRGRMTLADVICRIDDGRPGPEEAWAASPASESESVVWCAEWREAFFAALPHIEAGDRVAARMAFLERYRRAVDTARSEGRPAKWEFSRGFDLAGREKAVLDAIDQHRIPPAKALEWLPNLSRDGAQRLQHRAELAGLLPPGLDPEEIRFKGRKITSDPTTTTEK